MLPATLDFLVYALAFWTAARLVQNRRLLPYFAWTLTACAGVAAVLLIREYGQFVQAGMKSQRAQAPFFSPNFAAGFFALCLPFVVAFFVAQKERLAVLGTGVVAALMVGALAATGSRAGIALAFWGVGITLLLTLAGQSKKTRTFPWAKMGALVLVFALMAFGFRGPLTARVEVGAASSQEHSGDFRKETARGAMVMARANPLFGTGPGTFPFRYAPYARVARTDLAHQSYVQAAAEQGIPTLLFACAALAGTLGAGAMAWARFRRNEAGGDEADSPLRRFLLCGLIGGVVAGAGRSLFDSEWSLLGNGLPFWCLGGLLAGLAPMSATFGDAKSGPVRTISPLRLAGAALLVVPLVFCFLLLQTATVRDTLAANRARISPADVPNAWPPDPQLLYFAGQFEEATRVEPSGKRWYQLGLAWGRKGGSDADEKAAGAFQKSVEADPTNLQTWRRLAEGREKMGDTAGALTGWQELIRRHEGPIGQIRAIPELTEVHPAFAYFALAQAAQKAGKNSDARALYEKAEGVVERYSRTTPIYQQMEVQAAQGQGVDLTTRRAEFRSLYEQSMEALASLSPNEGDKNNLTQRKTETLARFDALLGPGGSDAPATPGEPR